MSPGDAPTRSRATLPADAGQPPVVRGRVAKRQAILDAALAVFAREGYERAGVDLIAAEAGAAKPTVYNHFGGKENLFREMVLASAVRSRAETLGAIEELPVQSQDLAAEMLALGHRLVDCFRDPRAWVLHRVLVSEAARFPDLLADVIGEGTVRINEALAGRFALLAAAGRLDLPDPLRAASHFFALTTGEVMARSAHGTRPTTPAELDAIVDAGVDTFLRAFTPRP